MTTSTILYSLLGGVLPALLWLAFWLHEDKKRPEPRGLLIRTFILGMCSVVLVLPFQKLVQTSFPEALVLAFLFWAILEEGFKYIAAWIGGLRTRDDDEPIDNVIYLITAALGFTALENALFIANPLLELDFLGGLITGNMRFIGASVLHVVASGIVGVALALSFYKKKSVRLLWALGGLILAILYHLAFNLIINFHPEGSTSLALILAWVGAVGLMLAFERVKKVRPLSTD
ncbi:MAG: PrsW family glutamic-type intramembrane protease [Parcubacteria group bacterium]